MNNKTQEEISKEIEFLLGDILDEAQLELFQIRVIQYKANFKIEVFIDKAYGGVTIDECTTVNKKIVDRIEASCLIENYTLEVSSPGFEWPLRTQKDFLRVLNKKVRFFLSEPLEHRLEYVGIIESADADNVMANFENKKFSVPLLKIKKAVQII